MADLLLAGDQCSADFQQAVDAADAADVAAVLALAGHPDPKLRFAVALNLPLLTHGDPPTAEMVQAAIALSADLDAGVRDYACFALGEQWREVDSPAVREALAARLDDADLDARCEALVGLSYRRDSRALPRVRAALSRPSGDVWRLEMIAAGGVVGPAVARPGAAAPVRLGRGRCHNHRRRPATDRPGGPGRRPPGRCRRTVPAPGSRPAGRWRPGGLAAHGTPARYRTPSRRGIPPRGRRPSWRRRRGRAGRAPTLRAGADRSDQSGTRGVTTPQAADILLAQDPADTA